MNDEQLTDEQKRAKRERMMAIATSVINTAYAMAMAEPFKTPIPNEHLLRKRAFPDRKMPNRVRRKLKKKVDIERRIRIARALVVYAFGASHILRLQATPTPDYASGGIFTPTEDF